jgi:DNA replication initiation complex subunit (GINS family)
MTDSTNNSNNKALSASGKVGITITYETLFDLLVRERGKDEIQKLDENFFKELVKYIIEKKATLDNLSEEEREKSSRQIRNINRLVKELYERREKKIASLALARSRAAADIIDTSALLKEEKAMFDKTLESLDFFREGILNKLLASKEPDISGGESVVEPSVVKKETPAISETWKRQDGIAAAAGSSGISVGGDVVSSTDNITQQQVAQAENRTESTETEAEIKKTRLIRFLHPVPKFVGKELEVYGPFDQEDIANLPREIAEVLITKGRAEEIADA